jgi:hypothetical protein
MSEDEDLFTAELHVASDEPVATAFIEEIDDLIDRQFLVGIHVVKMWGKAGKVYKATESGDSDAVGWGDTPAEAIKELAMGTGDRDSEFDGGENR